MEVSKCLYWSQPCVPHSSCSYPKTLAHAASSRSSNCCRSVRRKVERPVIFGAKLISKSTSFVLFRMPHTIIVKRCCSTMSGNSFSDEEFSKEMLDLALEFRLYKENDDDEDTSSNTLKELERHKESHFNGDSDFRHGQSGPLDMSLGTSTFTSSSSFLFPRLDFDRKSWDSDWSPREEMILERKAKSMELPLSLRMIKRKNQWQQGFVRAGESAYCSVKKAFSSLVFIIQELQSYTMLMRQTLLCEDLQGILARVQQEMSASFVWLFQQVFSHTPNLMVYVMILLANYSVYSMASNPAIAAIPPSEVHVVESVSVTKDQRHQWQSMIDSISGKAVSIGGVNGGGNKFRPLANGTDGDGRFDKTNYHRTIVPDEGYSYPTTTPSESVVEEDEEVANLWNSIVEEASEMQSVVRDETLDHETIQRFVSPISAKIEVDDYADYLRTEMLYQIGLSQEPTNSLLLANYAQFLYLVTRDYKRAEQLFLKAAKGEPKDAEALSKYATFLWRTKKDLFAAEEAYLEAVSVEPSNSYYASNYAHFLWNTGGEETCFPLNAPTPSGPKNEV